MRPTELNPDDEFAPYLRDCYRALLTRPEVTIIACAEAAARDYAQWLTVPESSKFCTLHNGMDTDSIARAAAATDRDSLRAELDLPADAPVIGTAFRFSEVKRPLRWIEAAAIVASKNADCRFVMFGDGALRQAAQEEISRRGLAGRFVLPGLVRDLYRRLPALDIFALSSRTEALPNVLIEAQAAGVPVVAYDVGGVRETFLDGITGFLVKGDSPDGLASALLRALSDDGWRRTASSRGPAFVRDRFGLDRMVNTLTEWLLADSGLANVSLGQRYIPGVRSSPGVT